MALKKNYNLFFISTNGVWGGSEVLWYQSATQLLQRGHAVSVAVKYENPNIKQLEPQLSNFINLENRYSRLSLFKRIANRIGFKSGNKDYLKLAIEKFNPDLVIISQGNSISSQEMMEFCVSLKRKFVIISQIVTDLSLFWLDTQSQKKLAKLFELAEKCYFVSRQNIELHNFLLAYQASNADVVYNPFSRDISFLSFPDLSKGYQIAIVGRLECYHKGLDILLKVIAQQKWQNRPVTFNFYGSGPHSYLIEYSFSTMQIKNAVLHGFTSGISEIWSRNHLLLQPSRMEGQSLALLEAIYLNRSAIVTNVGGAIEIIDDNINGFISKTATVADIDEAMERAWCKRAQWQEMGTAVGNKFRKVIPDDPIEFLNEKILSTI